MALNNSILGQPIVAANVNVNVDLPKRRVTVDVQSTQNTYFARVLGVQTENVAVESIAEAAQYSTGTGCAKPWFVPNSVLSTQDACSACGSNEVVISGGEVTAYAQSRIGQAISLKTQTPNNALAPSQFYAIRLPGSQGANDYRNNIATCANSYLRCGDFYSTEQGDMRGPTRQGVKDLIGDPPTDSWVSSGLYQTPYGLSDSSRNIVVAPIWDTCGVSGFCPGGKFPSGSATVQIIGFAAFFLEGVQGTDVVARLISLSSCGDMSDGGGGGAGSTDTGGTVLSLPLRLVRTQ